MLTFIIGEKSQYKQARALNQAVLEGAFGTALSRCESL
jgi:hypothetical protein